MLLDSIRDSNPLMRDETRFGRNEMDGYVADAALLSEIEKGKAVLVGKICAARTAIRLSQGTRPDSRFAVDILANRYPFRTTSSHP